MPTLPEIICDAAASLVMEKAAKGSDGFRQWVYPHLPKTYATNREVFTEIEAGMLQGKSAIQIARAIYAAHS